MKQPKKNSFFNMKMSSDGKSGDIFIYGEITKYAWEEMGEHSAVTFQKELEKLGDVDVINLYVNSPGGSVFEGISIYNMLKRHKAKVVAHVDALAASIASVIIMSADEIRMPSNSMLMIHNPWTIVMGNAEELRKQADDLERIGQSSKQSYLEKAGTKLSDDKLQEMLDDETWLSAEEAFEIGLCDVVEVANEAVAKIDKETLNMFKNAPSSLAINQQNEINEERRLIAEQAKENINYVRTILGGI